MFWSKLGTNRLEQTPELHPNTFMNKYGLEETKTESNCSKPTSILQKIKLNNASEH